MPPQKPNVTEEQFTKMIAEYGTGVSLNRLANTGGYSRSWLADQFTQRGVKLRDRQEAARFRESHKRPPTS
jgi:hypothetical protein